MVEKICVFGQYQNYSEEVFDDGVRTSRYVEMRDGTRLAIDIFRPTSNGAPVKEKLPALWTHTRYQRAFILENGKLLTCIKNETYKADWLISVIRHGYVVVTVDVRGGGASFGVNRGQYSSEEANDAYDVTEWIAAQPWCNGEVGMFGRSYLGITQYFAASKRPPHLKTLFPEMASFDHYLYCYSGGVFRDTSRFDWHMFVNNLDQSVPMVWRGGYNGPVSPVDNDDGELLRAALWEHRGNLNWYRMLVDSPYRDSIDPATEEPIHVTRSASTYIDLIEKSAIPIYHLAGWYDMFPRDSLLWWKNLSNPQKVVIGPWYHVDSHELDQVAEHLRWYDYWLKGIDNGIMDEEPIHYWTIDAKMGEEWRATWTWPLADETRRVLYFAAGRMGTSNSINDGLLTYKRPTTDAYDCYTADYSTTSGLTNRWGNANGGATGYLDLSENDGKGLTFTTKPLEADVEITGHPVVHLWVSVNQSDCAFYVYLEDIHPNGNSQYVTEGVLLGSHRKLSDAPWDNMNLPYHSGLEVDIEPMPETPVELVFDLQPISKRFPLEHRIRVTVTCADDQNDRVPLKV